MGGGERTCTVHEVYLSRILRGNAFFAANVLGARGALLSALVHFFEPGRWRSPVQTGAEGQTLTADDQLFILMQAALYLTVTRGMGAPEVRLCYERAEALCHALKRPLLLYSALLGQWRYSFFTDKADGRHAGRPARFCTGPRAGQPCVQDGGLPGLEKHVLLYGRFRGCTTAGRLRR